ncbi:MAG TPA: glycosyltransferase family 39 protein [Candidatus Limnocylindrales bacterium]|nr:glycosyltransferase family 39 protein [Candidatus Limnocylindrales bacterium]
MTSILQPGLEAELPHAGRLPAVRSWLRGRDQAGAWARPVQIGLAALAAVVYLVNLTISGYANTYYSAAALAASKSWSAWFFGSFDAANFITVDKPPLATMLMGLSVRLFGLSSWSILLPEALAGVATVALLFVVVRHSFGPIAAAIAGLVMILTPVAALIFRFNNPDAILTLLLVAAAWSALRAIESGRLRWIVVTAIFVGLAFNTKYLQGFLVVPAFSLTWLIAAPVSLRRRIGGLLLAGVALLVSSGWWVLAVELIPAAARPFIGGSTNNSALQLLLGYDGLARIFGGGDGVAGGGGGGFSGATGILRLFNAEFGGGISWLIPFALIGLVSGLVLRGRAARTDRARAGYLVWGLWLVVHVVVFSFMSGIIHSYYAVALAPAIAALVGAGAVELWALRERARFGGIVLAGTILISAIWSWQLLGRSPDFVPGLGLVIVIVGAIVAVIVSLPATAELRRTQALALALGIGILLAGPLVYTLDTIATGYSGGDPHPGPAVAADSTQGGPGGGFGGNGAGFGGNGGGFGGGTPPSGAGPGAGFGGGTGGGIGAGSSTDTALAAYLEANKGNATWIVAMTSAMQAGSLELSTGDAVMAMGGFTGSDPAPSLAQIQAYVASGQLRYVLVGGNGGGGAGGPGGNSSTASAVTAWVTSFGKVVDYGGSSGTLYDLSGAATTGS